MIEFIVKAIAIQGVADHPWVLLAIPLIGAMWVAGRRIERRDEVELHAKRQEAVDLMARLRDRRAARL